MMAERGPPFPADTYHKERRWVLSAHAKKRVKNFNFGAILGRALASLLKIWMK